MPLTAAEIRDVLDEIREDLVGAHLQKITQPRPDRVCLRLRRPGTTQHLLLVASPEFSRLHLIDAAPPSPSSAPEFCMALRKYLGGARLSAMEQSEGDRRVSLLFTRGPSGSDAVRLEAELFGRGANLVAVDDDGIVRAVLHPRPHGARPLVPGAPYPAPDTPRPATGDAQHDPYAAPPAARTAEDEGAPDPADDTDSDDARSREAFAESFPISARLAATSATAEAEHVLETERRTLAGRVKRARKKLASRSEKIERERRGLGSAAEYERLGQLLQSNLGPLGDPNRRGLEHVEVTDWYAEGTPTVRIPLRPKQTLIENMEAFFRRSRKADRAAERIAEHRAWIDRELAALDAVERALADATSPEDLDEPREALRRHTGSTRSARRADATAPGSGGGPRRFVSKDGVELLVGRNARDNDALTFRIARGNDLWFHVRDYPGSHVVARTEKGQPLPRETLLDAAVLAMHFSEARDHATATIQYTHRKHLRKPRGAAPGQVLIAAPKTVFLRPDPPRLERLLGASGPFSTETPRP